MTQCNPPAALPPAIETRTHGNHTMPYNSIVIAREVWDNRDLLANVVAGNALNTSALAKRFEPEDLNSLETALQLKDQQGGTVTVLAVGAVHDVDVLRESLFRGVDRVVRVLPSGDSPDTRTQALCLAAAIRKLGDYDFIFTGVTVPEGESSMLGVEVAALLGVDHVSYVDSLNDIAETGLLCKREIEMGNEYIRIAAPAVLVMGVYLLTDDPRTPRSAKAMLKLKKKKTPIPEWTAAELGIEDGSDRVDIAGYQAVPQKTIDTTDVDPEDAAALKSMLQEVL